MSTLNPFLTNDAFTLASLTAAINDLAYTPSLIRDLGVFEERGQPTTAAIIEELNEVVSVIAPKPRNAPGSVVVADKRVLNPIGIPHIPQRASIMADEVQGVREFGSENTATPIQAAINARLAKMRRQIDYTIEYHRMLALAGNYMDINGDTKSAYTLLGGSRDSVDFVLGTTTTKIREKCLDAIAHVEEGLGGAGYTGLHAICSAAFWAKLITHAKVEETFVYSEGAALRAGLTGSFQFGEITWHRYRGTSSVAVTSGKAFLFPVGVADMYLTRFAPANYMETVNTIGLPYYAKSNAMPFDKGMELEAQSNVLNVATRPTALVELTTSN